MVKATLRARVGLSSQVPALRLGELGYDTDRKVGRIGDDTPTPPRTLTDKTTGEFDLSGITPIFSNEFLASLSTPGPNGWTPQFASEERDDGRVLIKIVGYSGGSGDAPANVGYYLRDDDVPTANHNLATDFRGKQGVSGVPAIMYFNITQNGELVFITSNDSETAPAEAIIDPFGNLHITYEYQGNIVTTTVGRVLPIFKGLFDPLVQYSSLDEVLWQGKGYRAIYGVSIPIGTLPSDATKWQQVGFSTETILPVALSDEVTPLVAANGVAYQPLPTGFYVTGLKAYLNVPQSSGATLTFDVKRWDGAAWTSILSTLLTIDNNTINSGMAAVPPVISFPDLPIDTRLRFDITQIGDGTAIGAKLFLIGYTT